MIQAAENVAQHYHISRDEQDEFAFRSHQKTASFIKTVKLRKRLFRFTQKDKLLRKMKV